MPSNLETLEVSFNYNLTDERSSLLTVGVINSSTFSGLKINLSGSPSSKTARLNTTAAGNISSNNLTSYSGSLSLSLEGENINFYEGANLLFSSSGDFDLSIVETFYLQLYVAAGGAKTDSGISNLSRRLFGFS